VSGLSVSRLELLGRRVKGRSSFFAINDMFEGYAGTMLILQLFDVIPDGGHIGKEVGLVSATSVLAAWMSFALGIDRLMPRL
jgi:hypothetical protein